ncbi:GntR family transcriptional regulator [Jannaschia seohaensis]|uniref:DNA-binding GntR family transcriptional regulator n=1 Tax=Jannaschia seohaensis TaxID=475081 RepID=A0A2Y9C0B6_9RHOB|nr:GntR family transcriptional regulator [Jannaschia seohaensis]PWJ19230.1 DNA-binding GntR family transcriptional regulator [Jannaschia seohaensis]SSA45892.1 DNA-binding transcriptional regulator, GntR family [Jannaschia seohaensis]
MPEGRVGTPDIYADLQRRLLTNGFAPGGRLMPSTLSQEYGCSANTVRDVLLQLSQVGLVDFAIQRGFRARQVSRARLADIARFRTILEQEGAVRSQAAGGLPWEARLTAAHHSLRHIESQIARAPAAAPFLDLWSDAEHDFHETLISECRLPPLIETFNAVYLQFRQQMTGVTETFSPGYFHPIIDEHQAILDAALSGDSGALRAAIAAHLERHL